jgi:hypothetical protein
MNNIKHVQLSSAMREKFITSRDIVELIKKKADIKNLILLMEKIEAAINTV